MISNNKEEAFDYAGEKLTVRIATDKAALKSLEADWRRLKAADVIGIFSSYEWIYNYWQYLNNDGSLFILTVSKNSTVRCIAPFMVKKQRFLGVPYKRLQFIGTEPTNTSPLNPLNRIFSIDHRIGWADKADFIALPEDAYLTGAIAYFLSCNQHLWDILDLREIQDNSLYMKYFYDEISKGGVYSHIMKGDPSAYINLSEDFQNYINSRSRNIRKNIKVYKNRFKKAGGGKFIIASTLEEVSSALPEVKTLEVSTWKNKEDVGAFSNKKREAFHTDLAESLAKNKQLILFLLKSETGELLAYYYSFRYGNKLYLHNTAFEIKAKKYSPGTILFLNVVEWGFKQKLARIVIGRGDQYFKNAYRTGTATRSWHFIFRNSLAMLLLTAIELKLLPWLRTKKKSPINKLQ